jgi:hypothetical protein
MKKTTYLIIGLFIVVLLVIYVSFTRQNNSLQNTVSPSVTPVPTAADQTYTNNFLGLSLHYPLNYTMKDTSSDYKNNLLSLQYIPNGGKSYQGVQLYVMPLNSQQSLQSWMAAYTTSSNSANLNTANNPYLIDQVNNLVYKTINGKTAAVFVQGDPTTIDSEYVTLLFSNKYLVFLGQEKDLVGSDYQQMLSSLKF